VIDLHAHTTDSDGGAPPAQLLEEARQAGLRALAICDHDTLGGYDTAAPLAAGSGVDLVCGIELSTRYRRKGGGRGPSIHMLGYFLEGAPGKEFRAWIEKLQAGRHDRNRRMLERLQALGVDITMDEVRSLARRLPGRPHFARLLVRKGYVADVEQAFQRYLDESAPAYVPRESPSSEEGIRRILEAGGLPSLAHPKRLAKLGPEKNQIIEDLAGAGLRAIEAYHSEHDLEDIQRYLSMAGRWGLAITGGSDYHGDNKPHVRLGMGSSCNGTVPDEILDQLRALARA
jgi:hypothetical protein